jgi:hypothetical protein
MSFERFTVYCRSKSPLATGPRVLDTKYLVKIPEVYWIPSEQDPLNLQGVSFSMLFRDCLEALENLLDLYRTSRVKGSQPSEKIRRNVKKKV